MVQLAPWRLPWLFSMDVLHRVSVPASFPALLTKGPDTVAEEGWETALARECFSGHDDPVCCLFLKKIDCEPLFIAGGIATDRG